MPSRISGACNGCRTKKQKCSGDRSGCTQCHAAGIQCTWPEQRKRGPAKGYIEGLEHRLHEAESLLLALLPLITSEQLNNATESLNSACTDMNSKSRDSTSPGPRNVRSSPPVLNKKTGIDYWESFPLDTVENIRKWQEDCAVQSQGPNAERQGSFRKSLDDVRPQIHNSNHESRQSSMDLKREQLEAIFGQDVLHQGRNQNGPFRSMSAESYRSGTSTPINVTSAARNSPGLHQSNQHNQQQQQQQQHHRQSPSIQAHNWSNVSLFNSIPTSNSQSNPGTNNSARLGAEAMLLQSFADSSWAQQNSLSGAGDMGMNSALGNGMESGPMEIDTGFFNSDLQRRLFW